MAPKRSSRRTGATPALENLIAPDGVAPRTTRGPGLVGGAPKVSESYGSPMTSRPLRSSLRGQGNDLSQATSQLFAQVREDRRRMEESRRAALAQATASETTENVPEAPSEPESGSDLEAAARPQSKGRTVGGKVKPDVRGRTKTGPTLGPSARQGETQEPASRKRKQSDDEDENDEDEQRHAERRLERQASRDKDLANVRRAPDSALLNLDVNQLGQQTARPTSQLSSQTTLISPSTSFAVPGQSLEPPQVNAATLVGGTPRDRPTESLMSEFSARSFIEESNIFATAQIQTPAVAAPTTAPAASAATLPTPSRLSSDLKASIPLGRTNWEDPESELDLGAPVRERDSASSKLDENQGEVDTDEEDAEDEEEAPEETSQHAQGRLHNLGSQQSKPDSSRPVPSVQTSQSVDKSSNNLKTNTRWQQRYLDDDDDRDELGDSPQQKEPLPRFSSDRTREKSTPPSDMRSESPERSAEPRDRFSQATGKSQEEGRPGEPEKVATETDEDEDITTSRLGKLGQEFLQWARGLRSSPGKLDLWSALTMALLSLFLVWLWWMTQGLILGHRSIHWYGWGDWYHNVGQLFPPAGYLSNQEYASLSDLLFKQSASIQGFVKRLDHTEAAMDTLNTILPQVVHVRRSKSGNVVIADDFWLALKDLIQHDKSIFNLDEQIEQVKKMDKDVDKRVQRLAEQTFSRSWESWLKNNQRKVGEILGQTWSTALPAEVEEKVIAHSEKLFKEKFGGKGQSDNVMTKEDFLGELSKALAEENRENSAEMTALRQKLDDLAKTTAKLVAARSQTGGLTRAEVQKLVDQATRDAIARARLQTAADSHISAHLGELEHKVNHFALGNGPQVDEVFTSPAYEPPRTRGPLGWLRQQSWPRISDADPTTALRSWEEPGACWCAGNRWRDKSTRPADLAVTLRTAVVPEHVVIEHIDPGATVDPLSMPKDVEIWARIEDYHSREVALNYMWATWPETASAHSLLAAAFVKIGAFKYEYDPQAKGTQVHRLSPELGYMGAETDHVIVRAVNNYGAADHTCFYRVRLYGEPREA